MHQPIKNKVIFSYIYIWNVIDALIEIYAFSFPSNHRKLIDIENSFRSKNRIFKGCFGDIDNIHVPMTCTEKWMHNYDRYFVQRKNKFALLFLDSCDSNRKVTYFDCSKFSRSHDSVAFSITKVILFCYFHCLIKIDDKSVLWNFHDLTCNPGKLPKWSCLLEDTAFTVSYHMLISDTKKM